MAKKTKKSHIDKKRHGQHHNQGHHYARVYWPYIPVLVVFALGLILGGSGGKKFGVLPYSTNISSSELLNETNKERSANNEPVLNLNSRLSAAAQAKANDMVKRNYWSHNTPDGQEPWVFIVQSGYTYQKAGENLAYGFNDSDETITGWMNSPGHRENLLDKSFTDVGFGFANGSDYQNSGAETVVVAMYATPHKVEAVKTVAGNKSQNTLPVNSLSPVVEPASIMLNNAQIFTGGQLPWVTFMIGLLSGTALLYLIIKHSLALKRFARESETFVLKHRFLDLILICLILTAGLLLKSAGFIR